MGEPAYADLGKGFRASIKPELDPLLAALIGKLPGQGEPFSSEARAAWLKMMAMAFDVAYGVAEDMPAFLAVDRSRPVSGLVAPSPAQPRPRQSGHDFYIEPDGSAVNADGIPVLAGDIPADTMVFDRRPITDGVFRDVAGILWADGTHGTAGMASGVSFCGPG